MPPVDLVQHAHQQEPRHWKRETIQRSEQFLIKVIPAINTIRKIDKAIYIKNKIHLQSIFFLHTRLKIMFHPNEALYYLMIYSVGWSTTSNNKNWRVQEESTAYKVKIREMLLSVLRVLFKHLK